MSQNETDPSLLVLRSEFLSKIKDALQYRDWNQLEVIAQQWIQMDPQNPNALKWMARASVSKNNLSKASYAYGRILEFDANFAEAKKFFEDYPSWRISAATQNQQNQKPEEERGPVVFLTPEQRRQLGQAELLLAKQYEELRLFGDAAERYHKSFEWHASQVAALGAAKSMHRSLKSREALQFLRKQLDQFPKWLDGRVLLGKINLDLGYLGEAQKEWQHVLQLDASNKEAMQYMQMLLSKPRQ